MGRSLFKKLLFDDSDEDEIMRRVLKGSRVQRKRRQYIKCDRLAGHKRLYLDYFADTPIDSAQKWGLSSLQKITATLRMLAYGVTADFMDEYLRIGESTAMKSQYSGHIREPTIVLEVVASFDLWIWHAFFGLPGSNNDINVLERSPIFSELEQGHASAVNYSINGHEYTMGYYLADGIYPKWSTFIKTIPSPQGHKNKLFAKAQEANRKDVERAFGVLQARFAIVHGPARFFHSETLQDIMNACVILHNMIVEEERDVNEVVELDYEQIDDNPTIQLSRENTNE
ncbi:uncharacterized protein LOC111986730 [Quercus suber]|uniref:uncharacterized protein LOC111986730 n=1 Tax=Quercus suber TaxID=58331 RepID=UPI000CE22D52|nr:uncharacterized protein LOC111986730 [Quercus suber]